MIENVEERIFTLSDVKRLYIASKKKIGKWVAVGAILAFLYSANRFPVYEMEATFKEAIEKSSSLFKDVFANVNVGTQEPQVSTLLQSYQVLRPLVEKLGLQVSVPKPLNRFSKFFRNLRENIQAERGIFLRDMDDFVFQDVFYEGENTVGCTLRFNDTKQFTLFDDQKNELAQGIINAPVDIDGISFTLTKCPGSLRIGVDYPLQFQSWITAAQGVRNLLKITSDKKNKAIFKLTYKSRDRNLGVQVLNELMHQYRCYLKRDHDEVAKEQLAYLEQKQAQLYGEMSVICDEHVHFVENNIDESGFIAVAEASAKILAPHQEMQKKIIEIEIQLSQLDQVEKEGKTLTLNNNTAFAQIWGQICHKRQDLRQQRDLLELSLCQSTAYSPEKKQAELKEVRNRRFIVEKFLVDLDCGNELVAYDNESFPFLHWTGKTEEEKDDFRDYLENYTRILSMREKMLAERFYHTDADASDLEGIDLATAHAFFVEYNAKLDSSAETMSHLSQVKREIDKNTFELGSFSSILKDPFSQKLIAEANNLSVALKDEKYHSAKEEERIKKELDLQRKILSDHLEQLLKVEDLHSQMIREKMSSLQKVSLDCIHRQTSVLEEQAKNLIRERKGELLNEKMIFEKKMGEIRASALGLPEKWKAEQLLDLKKDIAMRVIQTVTELVESKSIGHHLHHVESKPLDFATLPIFALKPRLLFKAFLGAFLFGFGCFFVLLMRQIVQGFPISYEKLKALQLPLLGKISSFCDGIAVESPKSDDLDVLRQVAMFAREDKVMGLFIGKGPDYSYALAENWARMGKKCLLIRCDFQSKFQKEDVPGLLQMWQKEIVAVPIRTGKGYDYINSGGYCHYGMEILQSDFFAKLITEMQSQYDKILLLFNDSLASAVASLALPFCEKAVVTASGEQTEVLTPFIRWGYDAKNSKITFVTSA